TRATSCATPWSRPCWPRCNAGASRRRGNAARSSPRAAPAGLSPSAGSPERSPPRARGPARAPAWRPTCLRIEPRRSGRELLRRLQRGAPRGRTLDLDPARLHGLGQFAQQLDMQQAVLQPRAGHGDVVGELEHPLEIALGDAAMQPDRLAVLRL